MTAVGCTTHLAGSIGRFPEDRRETMPILAAEPTDVDRFDSALLTRADACGASSSDAPDLLDELRAALGVAVNHPGRRD